MKPSGIRSVSRGKEGRAAVARFHSTFEIIEAAEKG